MGEKRIMKLTNIYEEHNADLFPFHFCADAWGISPQKAIGRHFDTVMLVFKNSSVKLHISLQESENMRKGLHEQFLSGFFEKTVEKSEQAYRQADNFSQKLGKLDLEKTDGRALAKLYEEFYETMNSINEWGMLYAFLEYGAGESTAGLEEYLARHADKTGAKTPVGEAFAVLTTPTQGTSLREMQQQILKLAIEVDGDSSAREIFSKNSQEAEKLVVEKMPKITAKLKELEKDFCWINYGYNGPAMPLNYFVTEVKQALHNNPSGKLAEMLETDEKTASKQNKLIKEFAVDEFHARRFKFCRELIHFKARRKEKIYEALYHIEKLQKEIARRVGLTPLQARYFLLEEICAALESGKELDADEGNSRSKFCVYLINRGKIKLMKKEDAGEWLKLIEKEESFEGITLLKGSCACAGKVSGLVRIVRNSSDIGKMKQGEILVSFSTNPNMVPGMRKAAAVVTEQGGIASHAAIVTREFNIPCVVGAKNATKILKDGELVEVDAANGIVRKIS